MSNFEMVAQLSRYRYNFISLLGEGGQGQVGLFQDSKLKKQVAIKHYDISQMNQNEINFIKREFQILISIEQENIVKCYELLHNKDNLFLVQDVIEGYSLMEIISQLDTTFKHETINIDNTYYLKYNHVQNIISQLLLTLVYLHEKKIIHRDIKLDNVMYSFTKMKATLIDFGCAKNETKMGTVKTILGTIDYMSPEMLFGQIYNQKTDIWSLAVLLYKLLTNLSPFKPRDSDNSSLFQAIRNADYYDFPENLDINLTNIVKKCLIVDYQSRPQAEDLLLEFFPVSKEVKILQILKNKPQKFNILIFDGQIQSTIIGSTKLIVHEPESMTLTPQFLRKFQAIVFSQTYQVNLLQNISNYFFSNLIVFGNENCQILLEGNEVQFHKLEDQDQIVQIISTLIELLPGYSEDITQEISVESIKKKSCC